MARTAWRDTSFQEVFRVSNRSGDYSISLSVQLRKRVGERATLYASYALSRAYDRMSIVNLPTRANFSNTPIDGTVEDRRLAPSFFETPHKAALRGRFHCASAAGMSLLDQGAPHPP